MKFDTIPGKRVGSQGYVDYDLSRANVRKNTGRHQDTDRSISKNSEKVQAFLREHPGQAFDRGTIARNVGLTTSQVGSAVVDLSIIDARMSVGIEDEDLVYYLTQEEYGGTIET